ncbi:MAG: thymidine phosphorylase, partial [Sciscionella sp.]|nr:thymidine phosphorylase [Sciscionella sp.]
IPLIASSIMSKKIAEGTDALVLDVKVGSGAFMKDIDSARELASACMRIGAAHGLRVAALLTDMSTPLGRAVGNALEVAESVDVLRGGGPPDVVELTISLAQQALSLAGVSNVDPGEVLASGRAYDSWRTMITAQGGDPDAPLPRAAHVHQLTAPATGYLSTVDALAVGRAAWRLGAGRARKEDPVQPAAGVLCLAKPGDRVVAGQPILALHTDTPAAIPAALSLLHNGVTIDDDPPSRPEIVLEIATP